MKLTKEYRNEIIDRCVTARFAEATKHYEAARTTLADALYEHAFGAAEPLAKKLPRGWFSRMGTVNISSEGYNSRYYTGDDSQPDPVLKLSRERLKPAVITSEFTIKEDHPLYPQTQAVLNLFNTIKTGKEELTTQLRSLLYSVTTREKLLDVWPEGEPFFPAVMKRETMPIPYDLTIKINRLMGIGAVEAGAQ
jgi:hypothetical protein